jgi:ATP-dependent Clp endopeptidase proteolytic subunit ClpP
MKEIWIRFMAEVNFETTNELCQFVDQKIVEKYDKLHLMIASSGGNLYSGIDAYNFLKYCPIEIDTYNIGHVESVAVVLYCIGKKRYSTPFARFMIHEPTWTFQEKTALKLLDLGACASNLITNQKSIIDIIAQATGRAPDAIDADSKQTTFLFPNEAKEYGLVHEITNKLMEPGAEIFSICNRAYPPAAGDSNGYKMMWKPASVQAQGTGPRYYCGDASNHGQFVGIAPRCYSQIR